MEKVYSYTIGDSGLVEKIVDTKDVSVAHAIVEPGESFPKHAANADLHIIIIRGILSAIFDGEEPRNYEKGNIIGVDKGTEMQLNSAGEESLEFFAVKAPSPTYGK